MAFNKDKFFWFIESFITHKKSDIEISSDMKKKFSDVTAYIKANNIGKSLSGKTIRDTDSGFLYEYEYNFGGKNPSYYNVLIGHRGEKIDSFKLKYHCEGAAAEAKFAIKKMQESIPDFVGEETKMTVEKVPAIDYSANTLSELVDVFDKKLQEFSKNPSLTSLTELENIKNAMNDKVNEKPLAERANFGKSISNIAMYIEAMKMQFKMPGANPTQFVGTYVPQITASLAELQALL